MAARKPLCTNSECAFVHVYCRAVSTMSCHNWITSLMAALNISRRYFHLYSAYIQREADVTCSVNYYTCRVFLTTWITKRCGKQGQSQTHLRQYVECFF